MRKLSLLAGMLIIFASTISPTSLNGRFVVLSSENSILAVQLQINTNTGTDDLGGATIVIGFDKTVLNFSSNPVDQTDFMFNNFSGGNYNTAKVTRPLTDKIWINIDLPYTNNNKGTVVSGTNNWTNVVTLYFNIINSTSTIKLNWLNSDSFWGLYDGDNKTQWSTGVLTDLEILPGLNIDSTPLDITNLTVTNSKTVNVKFSKKLNPTTAKDKNNYSISNNVLISQVQLAPDSSSVIIKTSAQQSNINYTLTMSGIEDQNKNLISPNPRTISYRISSKTNGGKVKNSISTAITTSWDGSYTADKMIDGYGMSTPDSRWQSAKVMPDTITYDLGENITTDSLRISFYKGESGRIYKYSLFASDDLTKWKPVVRDIWSDNSEWTEIEFDSTKGRYLKLILKGSNQGNKASIWEFESYGTKKSQQNASIISPSVFTLMQNYPNPFNPSTKIRYVVPESNVNGQMSNVVLKVYDILGNEVATVINEVQSSGEHEVEFEADGLASGIYIYRLQTAEFTDTKKMILLR